MIPSIQSNLTIRPWSGAEFYWNYGTGNHSFQDREPVGSIAVEQLTRATSFEVGMRVQPLAGIQLSASIWQVNLGADRIFLDDGEEAINTQSSLRRGLYFNTSLNIVEKLSIAGNFTFSQAAFRKTDGKVPLSPTLTTGASIKGQWREKWSSTFYVRHIGERTSTENSNTTLRPFTTFDFITNWHLDNSSLNSNIEMTLGVLNLTNTTGAYTQLFFDSQHGPEYAHVFNINYFSGQPRTFVAGMTWTY